MKAARQVVDWVRGPQSVEFTFTGTDGLPGSLSAALRDGAVKPGGEVASAGPLFRLVEDEVAKISDDGGTVSVEHRILASDELLSDSELAQIGLPGPAPFTVEVAGDGLLTDAAFSVSCRLLHADGRPVVEESREGCLIRVSGRWYVLRDPTYSLLRAIDAFRASTRDSNEERLVAWAEIQQCLPADAVVDGYLRSIRIARADAFTLQPFRNSRGEPDFDVVPGRMEFMTSLSGGPTERSFGACLPDAAQSSFARRFRARRSVESRYVLGDDWFLIPSPSLRRALTTVRNRLGGSPADRATFLQQPHAFIREAFGDGAGDGEVDAVFFDEDYSERVKGVGLWQAKVVPWLAISGREWLPPSDGGEAPPPEPPCGIQVGEERIEILPGDLEPLIEKVRAAVAQGQASVSYRGAGLPAVQTTLDALLDLQGALEGPSPGHPTGGSEPQDRVVLLIDDHLEQLPDNERQGPEKPRFPRDAPLPLASRLLEHQAAALEWLQDHWLSGSPGCLLADDMGLGKTLTSLAFLSWLQSSMRSGSRPRRPFLVVAPTGLLKNWRDEHARHLEGSGLGEPLMAYGSELRRLRLPEAARGAETTAGLPLLDMGRLASADWVLTTYETARDYQHSFGRVRWDAGVFDEVQKVKNPAAAVTEAAKALKLNFAVGVTGTPVENRMADLWCILDLIQPKRLGTLKEFSRTYEAQDTPLKVLEDLRAELLDDPVTPVVKRRLKANHLDGLPPKRSIVIERPMPEPQAAAYSAVVSDGRAASGQKGAMLKVLHALRSICLHPQPDASMDAESFIRASARLQATIETLDRISQSRERVLIFLESKRMQAKLGELIQQRYELDQPPLLINGDVSGPSRKNRVDDFQRGTGFGVMILSPRAGGVGLTLTAANHVIHLSRWWNPAVEDQCSDRVYRIGQERPVHIYYPLATLPGQPQHSFDLKLHALLEEKRELSARLLAPPAATDKDAEDLFSGTVLPGAA